MTDEAHARRQPALAVVLRRAAAAARGDALLWGALALLLLAVLLPPLALQRPRPDLLLAFDITQSMDVADRSLHGTPASRLAFAKAAAADALRRLPCGTTLGWAVFTGHRTLLLNAPLEVCAHFDALAATLDGISGRMRWANRSEVGKGVYWGLRSAAELQPVPALVFFSDAQEAPPLRDGQRGAPDKPDGSAGGLLVGVGGEVASPIPRSDGDGVVIGQWAAADVVQRPGAGSHEELSRLDAAHAARLAKDLGLDWLALDDIDALAPRLAALGTAQPREVMTDLRWLPAALALALLCLRALPCAAAWPLSWWLQRLLRYGSSKSRKSASASASAIQSATPGASSNRST